MSSIQNLEKKSCVYTTEQKFYLFTLGIIRNYYKTSLSYQSIEWFVLKDNFNEHLFEKNLEAVQTKFIQKTNKANQSYYVPAAQISCCEAKTLPALTSFIEKILSATVLRRKRGPKKRDLNLAAYSDLAHQITGTQNAMQNFGVRRNTTTTPEALKPIKD